MEDRKPETDLDICGTSVYDSGVIADQWEEESWLINGAYYMTNKSRLCQRMSWVRDRI